MPVNKYLYFVISVSLIIEPNSLCSQHNYLLVIGYTECFRKGYRLSEQKAVVTVSKRVVVNMRRYDENDDLYVMVCSFIMTTDLLLVPYLMCFSNRVRMAD